MLCSWQKRAVLKKNTVGGTVVRKQRLSLLPSCPGAAVSTHSSVHSWTWLSCCSRQPGRALPSRDQHRAWAAAQGAAGLSIPSHRSQGGDLCSSQAVLRGIPPCSNKLTAWKQVGKPCRKVQPLIFKWAVII